MRITNKVIQNNSLNNINTNKLLQDKLSNQMSTEKKVNRPSDDPIIAIRALRLRTNVNQVTQYYEKNVPDANSWLSITESALSTIGGVITNMIGQCEKGSMEDLTSTDRKAILADLKELRNEVYSTGNADYAGRTVFTGYRTDMNLCFIENTKRDYKITEQLTNGKIDKITYVNSGKLPGLNEDNFEEADYKDIVEEGIDSTEVYRIRTAYTDLNGELPELKIWDKDAVNADGTTGAYVALTEVTDADGNVQTVTNGVVSIYDDPSPYLNVGDNEIRTIKETGEILMGKNVYSKLMSLQDDPTTSAREAEIQITYQKSEWKKNDLRPEHYFACEDFTDPAKPISYNADYLLGIGEKQAIEYDVGLNQSIRVNTTADEAFTHDTGRDVDDLINAMEDTVNMENIVNKLDAMLQSNAYDEAQKATIQEQLDAAKKAFTLLKEKTQKLFESGITKMQKHLDRVNYAVTTVGTRSKKLELIENRLMSQKTNFETLQSENEDADIAEVAIQLTSAELTYNAALAATGKILQNSLMNFI